MQNIKETASYKLDVRTVNKSQLLGFYRFGTVGDVRSTSRRVETFGNIGYVFDSDGYLKLKNSVEGDTTYSYARTGELLEVVKPDSTIISYTNDPMGRRVAKLINGEIVEKYLWLDRTTLLAVYDGQDNLVQKFNYADSRVPYSMESNGEIYYLTYDQVGSLRAVSDSSGNIVKEINYDSFGNIISDSDESFRIPFGFAGGLQDTDTNLVRFGYRDYDPNIGKWTAKDPILFNGGDSNLYGYVLNDPIDFVDSKGLLVVGAYNIKSGQLTIVDMDSGKLITTSAESGGKPFGDPIPAGRYEILEQAQNPNSFRLDSFDNTRGNDIHDKTGRSHFRLHEPGNTIGCVAVKNRGDWDKTKSFINQTKTETTMDNSKSWYQFWRSPEPIQKYGDLWAY